MNKFRIRSVIVSSEYGFGRHDPQAREFLLTIGLTPTTNNETPKGWKGVSTSASCFLYCGDMEVKTGTPFAVVTACGLRGQIVECGCITEIVSRFEPKCVFVGRGGHLYEWRFACERVPIIGEVSDWSAMFCSLFASVVTRV